MSDEVGRELGNNIGKFIEVDWQTRQSDQAKFIRVRVDLQLDKPLRRGGKVASVEGEKYWVSFRYERLPKFCFQCGRLGHDEKHCTELLAHQNPKQYGDWLRAQGSSKVGVERSRSTSSEDQEGGNEERFEGNVNAATKISSALVFVGSGGGSGNKGNLEISKSRSIERHDVRERGKTQDITRAFCTQMEQVIDEGSEARDLNNSFPSGVQHDLKVGKGVDDAISLVGQQAHLEKEEIEVNSPLKPIISQNEEKELKVEPMGQRKIKAEAQWKRIAREKGKNKSPKSEAQPLSIGSKRVGKLIFEEEMVVSQKKQRLVATDEQNSHDEESPGAMNSIS